MNTTTAAIQAGVTADTIRTWCRRGVITATKQAGRWTIDPASLARRIEIGHRKDRMTTYRIEQGTTVQYRQEHTTWTIVRTDGTPAGFGPGKDSRIWDATFFSKKAAEFYAYFYEHTDSGYRIEKTIPRAGRMDRSTYWRITGAPEGDPRNLDMRINADTDPFDTAKADILISWAKQHTEGAAQRIQKKAEQDAIKAAEDAVREARKAQLDAARQQKGELATERQVNYILQLLAARDRSGEGGGFFTGPTDRAGIETLSKAEASMYITSLKGDY
ncbi:helix-turn-helix domain-containing protein [Streptomyces sp. NPDC058291]|uniref:helix-turn-helix domain-containing protein n=1 Tax=Streptomyces sp. NPDC058291 TaxID=3346427 RepID=UPI0036EE25EC